MSKNVHFERSSQKGGSRSSRHDRDSGVGSSSSDQASTGGKPDRKFTAQDREDQQQSVTALREALATANDNVKHFKKKSYELDLELSSAHKANREKEAARRVEFDQNTMLKDEIAALRVQVAGMKDDINELRDENSDLRQQLAHYERPVDPSAPMMTGTGSPSSNGSLHRSKSNRGSPKDQTERLRDRMNKTNRDAEPSVSSSSKAHRTSRSRRPSVSVSTRAPYIEEPPASPVSSRSFQNHYITTSAPISSPILSRLDMPMVSSVPRTTHSSIPSSHRTSGYYTEETGNYVPHPLPEDRSSKGKKR